ncbi:hypothetical protein ACFOZ5_08430 [Marinobacter lacisalsi]|uniref:Solute-binding protein family 3/N-terminal domain-containing protein n=1 Tax=Marinobacter lacisalsi TaxID=475979 RepID=A0ABV8QFA1_9GAMM
MAPFKPRNLGRLALAALLSLPAASALSDSDPGTIAPEPSVHRLWYRNYDSPAVLAALNLAFAKTPEYGPYQIDRSPEMVQGRAMLELEQEGSQLVTIANVATSPQREQDLYAIPLPIDGGLLGLRVCVIKEDHLSRFEGIQSLEDFVDRRLSIGQGSHWPDSAILTANNLRVVTHTRYETLFTMLRRERFDCFARGVSEVLFDLERVQNEGLIIEPNLLLAYPMPSYFFVGPGDHETAQRIQLGLERAIADGSFAAYLAAYYGRAVDLLKLGERTLLVLENPDLSNDSAPIGREALETLQRRISNGLSQ